MNTRLIAGGYKVLVRIEKEKDRLFLYFKYHKPLIEEIKVMEGAKYHGYDRVNPRKIWSILDSQRNHFQLAYLRGEDPYKKYNIDFDTEIKNFKSKRNLKQNQKQMTVMGLKAHYCIWAAEMGLGKTLSAIEVMEQSGFQDWFWVCPKTTITSANLEFKKWNCQIKPFIMTYEGLKKLLANWKPGLKPPHGLILDEASRVRNASAQRSQATKYLADQIRETWGEDGFVIEMSGSPSPKDPTNWWFLCEIACPGYLREGNIHKFRDRLCLQEKQESMPGIGAFNQIVTWWDDENKCKQCGKLNTDEVHQTAGNLFDAVSKPKVTHEFIPSKNEVSYLYKRMKGLVIVQFKKDCLDLPEMQYKIIPCTPTRETINAAKLITAQNLSVIKTLTYLRELSDGFQYKMLKKFEKGLCHGCCGKGKRKEQVQVAEPGDNSSFNAQDVQYTEQLIECSICKGEGKIDSFERQTISVPCPKDEAIRDILDQHEEVGRLVIYAGFTASVDRCTELVKQEGWSYIKIDGRGWKCQLQGDSYKEKLTSEQMIERFQSDSGLDGTEKIALIGHPKAAGMGLTLTKSPTEVYYSNDFDAEARIQSEPRIHRIGADFNRGCMIIDLFHLPTDQLVFNNLKAKRDLQSLTLGQIASNLKEEVVLDVR